MGNSTQLYCGSLHASEHLKIKRSPVAETKFSVRKYVILALILFAGFFSNEVKAQFNIPAGTYYFDNSQTNWSQVYLFVGHGTYVISYQLTSTGNAPDIFSYNLGSQWNGATGFYFANNSGGVTAGSSAVNINTAIGSLPSSKPTSKSVTFTSPPTAGQTFVPYSTTSGFNCGIISSNNNLTAPSNVVTGTNVMFYIYQSYAGTLGVTNNSSSTCISTVQNTRFNSTTDNFIEMVGSNVPSTLSVSNNCGGWSGAGGFTSQTSSNAAGSRYVTGASNSKTNATSVTTSASSTSITQGTASITMTASHSAGVTSSYGRALYVQYYINSTYNNSSIKLTGTSTNTTLNTSSLTPGTYTIRSVITDRLIYYRTTDITLTVTSSSLPITSTSSSHPTSSTTQTYRGATITINGSNLASINEVRIGGSGGAICTNVTVVSASQVTAVVPDGSTGGTIWVSDGTNSATSTDSYTNLGFISTGSGGNWSAGASWLGGSAPSASTDLVTIASGAPITLNTNATIAGLTINSGASFTASDGSARILTISRSSSATTLTNSGTWNNGSGGSTVVFTGAPSSGNAVHTTSGTIGFQNVTINKTGGSNNMGLTLGAGATLSGTLEIGSGGFIATSYPTSLFGPVATVRFNTGGTYDVNASDNTWPSTGSLPPSIEIASGTVNLNAARTTAENLTISGGTLALSAQLTVQGNWSKTGGTFTPNTQTVVFSGADNATLSGTGGASFYALTINKTSASNTITLSSNVTVTNTLTLTTGLVVTGSNTVIVTNTATGAISGGSSNSYISGSLQRALPSSLVSGSTYVFPVGKNGSGYYPISLVNPTTGTGAVTVTAEAFAVGSGGSAGSGISSISTSEYWSVASTGNFTNSSYSVTRPTAVSPNNVIGRSTTLTGSYNSILGTAAGSSITNSTTASGAAQQFFVLAQGVTPTITTSGTLSNFGNVCTGANSTEQSYTVSGDNLVANVTVTAPTGFQVSTTSGSGFGSSVTLSQSGGDLVGEPVTVYVRFSPSATGAASGNITHTSTSATTQNVAAAGTGIATPATPGSITGNNNPCASASGLTYSISSVSTATSYTWTVPTGWSITAGQGSTSITVTAGTAGQNGNVTVTASNTCGTSSAATLAVTVNTIPATPGSISGSASVCPATSNTYSITAVSGATSYTWTLPTGWSGTSTTNSINATSGAIGQNGNITVTANNACGNSSAQTLAVTVASSVGGTATPGSASVCPGGTTSITLTSYTGSIQWQRSTDNSVWRNITGATSATYNTAPQNITTYYRAVVTSGSCASANSTTATVTISDVNSSTAAAATYNGGWSNTQNDATTGFGAWALSTTSGTAGFFTGSTTDNDAGTPSLPNSNTSSRGWGMYAYSSATASAVRTITGTLSVGQSISFSMDNGSAQTGGTVGMGLQNGSGNNLAEVYFVGGDAAYKINDGGGVTTTTINFTRGGIEVTYTRTAATTYTIKIVRKEDGATATYTGRSFLNPAGGQVPAQIRFFNANAGSGTNFNLYFNSLSITNPVITTHPSTGTQTLNLGEDGTALSVVASGSGLSYQWYRNTTSSNSGGTAVGTNSASHTPNETTAGTYYYYVTVTGSCASATSNPSGAITVNNTNVWIGGFSGNDWNFGQNWSAEVAPNATHDVLINSGTPNMNVNYTLPSGKSLTISGSGSLSIYAGVRFTIAGTADFGGKNVVLRSNATGTASLGQITGSLTGATNVTVQRYIPAGRKWRGISMPLKSSLAGNSIQANWQNGGGADTPGEGVLLWNPTGTGGYALNGNTGANTNIRGFSGGAFTIPATTTGVNLFDGTKPIPYLVFITDYYKSGNNVGNMASGSAATTLSATGSLITTGYSSGTLGAGFHMIPNPYPSAVDFSTMSKSGVNNQFWTWDPKLIGFSGYGGYQTTSAGVTAPGGGSYGGSSTIIPNGSAFWVYSPAGGGLVSIAETDKSSGDFSIYGRLNGGSTELLRVNLTNPEGDQLYDGVAAAYTNSSSVELDPTDAFKFGVGAENISIRRFSKDFAIEFRPLIDKGDTIFLKLHGMQQKQYQLNIIGERFDAASNLTAVLQDLFLGTETPINIYGNQSVNFSVTNDAASSGDRFRIVFRQSAVTPVTDLNSKKGISLYPNPVVKGEDAQIQFRNMQAGKYTVVIYSVAGSKMTQYVVTHGGGTAVQKLEISKKLPAGSYFAEISGENGVKEKIKLIIQ